MSSYREKCEKLFIDYNKLKEEHEELLKRWVYSVAKECKCETNTAVNHETIDRNLVLRGIIKKMDIPKGVSFNTTETNLIDSIKGPQGWNGES